MGKGTGETCRKVIDNAEAWIRVIICSESPEGASHWVQIIMDGLKE